MGAEGEQTRLQPIYRPRADNPFLRQIPGVCDKSLLDEPVAAAPAVGDDDIGGKRPRMVYEYIIIPAAAPRADLPADVSYDAPRRPRPEQMAKKPSAGRNFDGGGKIDALEPLRLEMRGQLKFANRYEETIPRIPSVEPDQPAMHQERKIIIYHKNMKKHLIRRHLRQIGIAFSAIGPGWHLFCLGAAQLSSSCFVAPSFGMTDADGTSRIIIFISGGGSTGIRTSPDPLECRYPPSGRTASYRHNIHARKYSTH